MKKIVLLLGLTIMVTSIFTACTAKDESGKSKGSSDTAKKTELVIWLTPQWKGVFDASEKGADYDSFFKEAGKRFTKTVNPNVTIKVEVIPGESRDERLNVAFQTNTLPDIVFEGAFILASLFHKGAIVPINDIVTNEDRADIAEGLWDIGSVNEDIFLFPFSHMPGTLVYNADMFKEAGLDNKIGGEFDIVTWSPDEFKSILKTLKAKVPTKYPFALFAKNNQADTWNLAYLRMFGNEFFDENSNLIVNEDSGVKALQYILDLYYEGLTVPGAESLSSNDNNAMFINQQVIISFTNSVLTNNLAKDMENGKVETFDFRLANIPGDPDPKTFTYVSGAVVMNTGNQEKIALAKEFVKFFSTDEELVLASKNVTPVRASVTEKVKSELPYLVAQNENARYLFNFSNNVASYSELRNVLFPEFQAALIGEKTAQEALDSYVEKGNVVIATGKENSVVYD